MGNFFKPRKFLFNNESAELRNKIMATYPYYHIKDTDIKETDITNAFLSWQTIMGSEDIETYIVAKRDTEFEFTSCLSWFFSVFYNKFFELCPESKEMFSNVSISAQGRLLAGVISSAFDILKEPERLERRLIKVVNRHNPMNIKAVYYGLMGEALLWTLQFILGPRYTVECALAWTKIYSYLLNIIIPRAVEYEYKLSLQDSRRRVSDKVSKKSTGSEMSTVRYSMRSIKITIEERIRSPVSFLRKGDDGMKQPSGILTSTKTCPTDILETTETRSFETSNNYCPFVVRRVDKKETVIPATVTAIPTSFSEKGGGGRDASCPMLKQPLLDLDRKPLQVEADYYRQDHQRICPMDNITPPPHSDRKNDSNNLTDSQHKTNYKKTLITFDSFDCEDLKVPYFNHNTEKYPKQPLGITPTATTDCHVSDISYEDFKVNKLNRFIDKTKLVKK